MSVRGLIIGDPHFKVSNLLDVDTFIEKIEIAVRRIKPDFIVCLGDLLDSHERIHVDPLNKAIKFLELLSKHNKTFLLIGNHDRRNNSDFLTDIHPFNGLKYCENLIIVDYPTKYEIQGKSGAVGNFLFVPYVEPGRLYEALDLIPLDELGSDKWQSPSIDCIFCHQEFYGCNLGPIKSVNGDRWDETFPLVISGHIHDYNKLQSNLLYVGTPFQQTFSEAPDKAIIIIDFNTQTSIEAKNLVELSSMDKLKDNPQNRSQYVRIHLGHRIKRTIKIKVNELPSFRPNPNELIKLIIEGTPSELKALNKSEYISRLTKAGIKFTTMVLEDSVKDVNEKEIKINKAKDKTFLELFRELIQHDKDLLPCFDNLFMKK